ncbi:MAG: rhodanese-like domain-containing protein [Eubacteriales bacterium]
MKKMKNIMVLLLVLLLIASFTACSQTDDTDPVDSDNVETNAVEDAANAYFADLPEDINKIDQVDFVDKVKAEEDMVILDIRQADVYGEGHAKGAVNVPWGTAISDSLDQLPTDKTIMVYCYTGQTAGQTVALLKMAGFDAKTVNLGWNLGISKVEGVDDIIETTVNELPDAAGTEVDPAVKEAITDYFTGLADVADTTYANYKISEADAKALVDAKDDSVMFLSIRSAEDFGKGHIEGAVNIPFGKGMQDQFSTLPTDKKVIVYCYTGQTAGQTVAVLRMLGYDAVSLNAGMGTPANAPAGWANLEYPVVTE